MTFICVLHVCFCNDTGKFVVSVDDMMPQVGNFCSMHTFMSSIPLYAVLSLNTVFVVMAFAFDQLMYLLCL